MHVQINTGHNIEGREALNRHLEETVHKQLSRFEARLTLVEMHITDENADRDTGHDKRCVVEARPAGLDPIAVSDQGDSVEQASAGALGKMVSALDRTFGKLSDRKGH